MSSTEPPQSRGGLVDRTIDAIRSKGSFACRIHQPAEPPRLRIEGLDVHAFRDELRVPRSDSPFQGFQGFVPRERAVDERVII